MARARRGWRAAKARLRLRKRVPHATTATATSRDPSERRRDSLTEKAADFDSVRAAVDDAAGFVRGLWVTFVSLATYLVIAAASVTHRQLFLATPIKLPLLDVELPLVAFFIVAPLFFLVFHFYLLLQLVLLAEKVARYNAILAEVFPAGAAPDGEADRNLRLQLPNDILVQFLAGPRGRSEGAVRQSLWVVAWATMTAGPLVVFMTMQYRFLPYQDEAVTWVQRGAVILDLAMLWRLWPGIVADRSEWRLRDWRPRASIGFAAASLASLALLAASSFALTFPGELMDGLKPARLFHKKMVWPLEQEQTAASDQGPASNPAPAAVAEKPADPSSLRATLRRWAE